MEDQPHRPPNKRRLELEPSAVDAYPQRREADVEAQLVEVAVQGADVADRAEPACLQSLAAGIQLRRPQPRAAHLEGRPQGARDRELQWHVKASRARRILEVCHIYNVSL